MVKNDRPIPISLTFYWSKPVGKEYLVYATPIWMQGITIKEVKDSDVKAWVEYQLDIDIKIGYIYVKQASYKEIVVAFNCEKWMNDNFGKDARTIFEIPRTLVWYFRKLLPATITSHVQWNFFKLFIEAQFKAFLKSHSKSVFAEKMKILKKVNFEWFTYDVDLQMNKITMKLKTTVMFALLVGASTAKKMLAGPKVDPWSGE
jgi:hypothetical protein